MPLRCLVEPEGPAAVAEAAAVAGGRQEGAPGTEEEEREAGKGQRMSRRRPTAINSTLQVDTEDITRISTIYFIV